MRLVAVMVGLVALVFWGGTWVGGQPAASESVFSEVGSDTYEVPAGICTIHVTVFGAAGGTTVSSDFGSGGLGGQATATLSVLPNLVLEVNVGGEGSAPTGATGGVGGFNGGGGGGDAAAIGAGGGGGGGASDVREPPYGDADRLVVAGGGGGSGTAGFAQDPADGGAGGGTDGAAGLPVGSGGGGGTQSSPGSGGGDGSPGSGSQGGAGGSSDQVNGGGGGGGGLFGGGGGSTSGGGGTAAAGGGGSGHTPDGTGLTPGVRSGGGEVIITYDPASDACPVTPVVLAPRFTG